MKLMPLAAITIMFYFMSELRSFLNETPAIRTSMDIERFKTIVARQMYVALVQVVVFGTPGLLMGYAIFTNQISVLEFLYMMSVFSVGVVQGLWGRKIEKQVQTLPVPDPKLKEERDQIVYVWKHKPFPTW